MAAKKQEWIEFAKKSRAEYYARGQRSLVYRVKFRGKDAIAKVERKDRNAVCRALNEARWLKILNKKGIGPMILLEGSDFIVIEFVEGKRILEFAETAGKAELRKALLDVMMQCRLLDEMKVSKEEMHNPWKHIIISRKPVMIDFERCHYDAKPKNVTQFCQFLMSGSMCSVLECRGMHFSRENIVLLLRKYKNDYGKPSFDALLRALRLCP